MKEWLNGFHSEPEDADAQSIQTRSSSEDRSMMSTPDNNPSVYRVGEQAGLAREDGPEIRWITDLPNRTIRDVFTCPFIL